MSVRLAAAVSEGIEEEAKKDGSKLLHTETATVVNKLIQDNTAYIIVRGSNGKEKTIQYDLTTKKMLWHS